MPAGTASGHRQRTAATVLLIAGLVAGSVWFGRWVPSAAPPVAPIAPATSVLQPALRWHPFAPYVDPGWQLRGKPVLITQRTFAGQPLRIWAYVTLHGKQRIPEICVAEDQPGGGGSAGCQPYNALTTTGGGADIGDQVQLVDGFVPREAKLVRLELARAGVPLPPIVVRTVPAALDPPVNIWFTTIGRTVDIQRMVLLDAAGRDIGGVRGLPSASYLLPPAGPVTVLGHAPAATGTLRVAAYDASTSFTCIQVIPDWRPEGGFVKCAPPPPAPRPALEANAICSGNDAILYGTAPRTARGIWITLADAAPLQAPAFDGGAHFGRAYWALLVPNHAEVRKILALGGRDLVVASKTATMHPSC